MLVAVTVVLVPGEFEATYVAVVVVCALKLPVVADHITPAAPTSFVTVAVKFNDCPSASPPRLGVNITLIAAPAVTVSPAATDFVLSATDVAVSITMAGAGTLAGAVYTTGAPEALVIGVTDPHVAPLQPVPESVQFTPLFCASFVTLATKFCVWPTCTLAVIGEIPTAIIGPVVTVIAADADLLPSARDVAVSMIGTWEGTVPGAVYVIGAPDALVVADNVPQKAPLQFGLDSDQLTPLFCGSFVTVAVRL